MIHYQQRLFYELYKNYPNPFNNSTTISYNIHQDAYIRTDIFNILRHHIKKLYESDQKKGPYKLEWDTDGMQVVFIFTISQSTEKIIFKRLAR